MKKIQIFGIGGVVMFLLLTLAPMTTAISPAGFLPLPICVFLYAPKYTFLDVDGDGWPDVIGIDYEGDGLVDEWLPLPYYPAWKFGWRAV